MELLDDYYALLLLHDASVGRGLWRGPGRPRLFQNPFGAVIRHGKWLAQLVHGLADRGASAAHARKAQFVGQVGRISL
jgi:hypothetical protein